MKFADIPGLTEVKDRLYRTIEQDHVAHAQLLEGNTGSANLAMAIALATVLNCEQPSERDACGVCSSCVKSQKFIHPDIHFVFPVCTIDKKEALSKSFLPEWRTFLNKNPYGTVEDWSNHFGGENKQLNISKEESRSIIRDLSLKAFEGRYKVMIIWQADYMHPSAANGILKILEEPPEQTVFLLTTHDRERLISTILSRTQLVNIRPFDDEEIASYLQERHGQDTSKAMQMARIADGDLNEAVRLISEVEEDSHDVFRTWMRHCYARAYDELVDWADKFSGMNKVVQKSLLQYGLGMMRESLVSVSNANTLQRVKGGEEKEFVDKFSANVLKDYVKVEALYREFNTFLYHLERNGNAKILFLDTSLRASKIMRS